MSMQEINVHTNVVLYEQWFILCSPKSVVYDILCCGIRFLQNGLYEETSLWGFLKKCKWPPAYTLASSSTLCSGNPALKPTLHSISSSNNDNLGTRRSNSKNLFIKQSKQRVVTFCPLVLSSPDPLTFHVHAHDWMEVVSPPNELASTWSGSKTRRRKKCNLGKANANIQTSVFESHLLHTFIS